MPLHSRPRSAKRRRYRRHASNPRRKLLHHLRRANCPGNIGHAKGILQTRTAACRRLARAWLYARPLCPNRGCEARAERTSRRCRKSRPGPTRRQLSVQITKARWQTGVLVLVSKVACREQGTQTSIHRPGFCRASQMLKAPIESDAQRFEKL